MATLLSDDFSEANGTSLSGKALDVGGSWVLVSGGMTTDGLGHAKGGGAGGTVVADAGTGDVTVTVTGKNVGGSPVGIVFRYQDANNRWLLYLTATALRIYEVNAGSVTQRDINAQSFGSGIDHSFSLTLSGNSISGTVDGFSVSYSSSFLATMTLHGFLDDGGAALFSSFLATGTAGGGGATVGADAMHHYREHVMRGAA